MWFLRRMLRIPLTAKKSNADILTEASHSRQLVRNMRRRQAKFVGHIIRKEEMENLVTTGKLDGKRSRGRQREKILDGLTAWMKTPRATDTIRTAKDRVKWRSMITNASWHGTS